MPDAKVLLLDAHRGREDFFFMFPVGKFEITREKDAKRISPTKEK